MMGIGVPGRRVVLVCLVPPIGPALARSAGEQLEIRSRAARLDHPVLLVWLSRMLALARRDHVDLAAPGSERPRVLAAHAEEQEFRHVAEVKADAPSVRSAVAADLVPDDVGLVRK